ncbi:MAG TPA: DUF1778 domain-containing protein [Candidatus Megaira endosymbiont of Mesostigma viride]|nr:DUF1778 domain-containing protein [Candidatus Megaira endosymbiont of Mesostigma viride]
MKSSKVSKTPSHNSRLEARVSPHLKKLFVRAAKVQGISLTDFIVTTAKKEAESILKLQTLINLSLKDMSLLVKNCVSNEEPNNKLRQAASRFKSTSSNNNA